MRVQSGACGRLVTHVVCADAWQKGQQEKKAVLVGKEQGGQ